MIRVLVLAVGMLVLAPALADDCKLAERYRALAAERTQADAPGEAMSFLRRAVEACPTYTGYEDLAERGAAVTAATDDDRVVVARDFASAAALAKTSTDQARTLSKYAAFLEAAGSPQMAYRHVLQARALAPNDPEVRQLAEQLEREYLQSRPSEVTRSIHLTQLLPEVVLSASTKAHATHAPAKDDAVATAKSGPAIDIPIRFKTGTVELEGDTQSNVEALAHAMAEPALVGMSFRFIGHCDRRGSDDFNQALSLRRAQAIGDAVVAVEPGLKGRLHFEGRGAREPLNPGADDQALAANRRLEVRIQ